MNNRRRKTVIPRNLGNIERPNIRLSRKAHIFEEQVRRLERTNRLPNYINLAIVFLVILSARIRQTEPLTRRGYQDNSDLLKS